MKWFWTIMAIVTLATVGWFVWSSSRHRAAAPVQDTSAFDAPHAPETETAATEAKLPEPVQPPSHLEVPAPAEGESTGAAAGAESAAPVAAVPGAGGLSAEEWLKSFNEMLAKDDAAAEAPADGASEALPSATEGKAKWEVVSSRRTDQPDGSILFDERFSLTGKGTNEDPFIVNWDYLVSASETFQPRLGKNRLPERIMFLSGKWVRVVGYVAFPILSTSPNEMLSMRNVWDGCCIGIPPTPYDAIEVRLKDSASPQQRLMRFGTVEGKLTVDPFIKGNWLLGLYVMDDAQVSESKNAGL